MLWQSDRGHAELSQKKYVTAKLKFRVGMCERMMFLKTDTVRLKSKDNYIALSWIFRKQEKKNPFQFK